MLCHLTLKCMRSKRELELDVLLWLWNAVSFCIWGRSFLRERQIIWERSLRGQTQIPLFGGNLQQFLHTRVMETGSRAKHPLPLHYRGSEICNTLLQRWNVGSPEHLNFVLLSSAFFLDWVYNGPDINILWVIEFWWWWWGEAHHHHGRRNQAACLLLWLLVVMANFIPTNVFKLLLNAQQLWFH